MMTPNATQIGEHTRRIVGLRLLPFLFILYIVNYVDRTNLAYAAVGMSVSYTHLTLPTNREV